MPRIPRRLTRRLDQLGPTAIARSLTERGVSRSSQLRGGWVDDGRITLLTVDFRNLTGHALRLAASFRRHVDPLGCVVVVQNGSRRNNARLRDHSVDVRGFGLNLQHGRALDWGLRSVRSQYVLVCDPDTLILGAAFAAELRSRLERFGVAGSVAGPAAELQYYHPVCVAFETRLWKQGTWSMIDDLARPEVPNDVGWELTRELGGLNPDALLPQTRAGYAGGVFAESFTVTWGMSRIHDAVHASEIDGRPTDATRTYQQAWTDWVERVARGDDDVDGFPS